MDPPASLSPSQPWRAAAIVAAAIAAVELVLLVLLGLAAVARPLATAVETQAKERALAPKRAAPAPGRAAVPPARLPRTRTSVIVLNGNGVTGAAGNAASLVRSLRYLVAGTANAPRTDFRRSLVMYRPGFRGEAFRLADDLNVKRVVPLDGLRAADLRGAHVALIVGSD